MTLAILSIQVVDPFDEALEEIREVPDSFAGVANKITVALLAQLNDDDFSAMAVDPVASPVLQLLMVVQQKNAAMLNNIVMRFFDSAQQSNVTIDGQEAKIEAREDDKPHSADKGKALVQGLITHPIGSHVMQRLLLVCPANLHNQLYSDHFRHNIAKFCNHSIANFVVASLVKGVKSETIFGLILDELSAIAEQLMSKPLCFLLASKFGLLNQSFIFFPPLFQFPPGQTSSGMR